MDLTLENREWKAFRISDVFVIKSGTHLLKEDMNQGNKPFVGATDSNNGVTAFVSNSNNSEDENVLGVNWNGSVVENFYHPYKAIFSGDVKKLKFKEFEGNKYLFLFVKATILKQKERYSYGYKFNGQRMAKQNILLPVSLKGEPDYEFMEQYMRHKEQEKQKEYQQFIQQRIDKLKNTPKTVSLKEKEWGGFFISDLFNNKIGKSIDANKVNRTNGKVAYITRKESNNALDGFITYNERFLNKDFPVITIGNETAEPFVQNFKFFTGTKVNILKHKEKISNSALSFIATSLKQHKLKYSYSFTINSTRLKKQKIMLPINENNEPDYKFMENYMKNIELKKLTEYLKFKNG